MSETRYMISDASRLGDVEAHVLRYWEEELGLPIGRNEMGHRYYTEEDIRLFRHIKGLKDYRDEAPYRRYIWTAGAPANPALQTDHRYNRPEAVKNSYKTEHRAYRLE